MSDRHSRSGPPAEKPEHPHGGPPGQTGQNPGHGGTPPGQTDKPPKPEEPQPEPKTAHEAGGQPRASIYVPPPNPEYDALEREQARATQQAPVEPNEPVDEAKKA